MSEFQIGLAVFGAVLGVAILALSVPRLVRLIRDSVLHRLPMMEEQAVQLKESGPLVLHLEGPRFIRSMVGSGARLMGKARLEFSLRNQSSGLEIPSQRITFQSRTKGVSKTRISVARFQVESPGEHALAVTGLTPDTDTSRLAVLLTRPYQMQLLLLVLATVLGGNLLLFSVIFPLVRALGG